ncbi:sodium:proton antiporter [Shewanella sp. NIFS-20-20]|uniref:cation:proton antiporter n=1 Tax=Shewanella sp. NIFS-20-20 TaxID=2853806 RepID=UPI001C4775CC|nr:sodium:proton antiporter [Shewanella sp. NIFS-20-20]MBV7315252.1 sodium:proton antiporter [Shewanella sp. NIFS-20-20]
MALTVTGSLALIGVLSLLCQYIGWRLRIPAILPLLLTGLLFGPGLGVIDPDAIFGDLLFPLISLGVAIILFEGSLTLNFKDIKEHGRMVSRLVSLGMLVTWVLTSLACYIFMDFSLGLSCLFGALVVVTGPTVIVPMLRSIKPKAELSHILRWEGILIDPLGALLAVLVYEYIVSAADPASHVLIAFSSTIVMGLGLGSLAGFVIGLMIRGRWLPLYLKNSAVLILMLAAYVLSNQLQDESGLLTVTVMGVWLANMRGVEIDDIIEFKETLTVLLISALFILLAGRLNSDAMVSLGFGGVGVLAVVMLIARPISVWLSAANTRLSRNDKWFLSWMAPRGIVAAAVSSLFAIKLQQIDMADADKLVPLVFMIIIGTVVIQSLTASWWAKKLGVTQGKPQGLLIFGAGALSRELAKVLTNRDFKVILADTNWDNIRLARMDNLSVYFGNPSSEHAQNYLQLAGIGRLLIISPYRQLNPGVSVFYRDLWGAKVFELALQDISTGRHAQAQKHKTLLFGQSMSYAKLASLMAQGWQVKATTITETFTFEQFCEQHNANAIPLCYVQEGQLQLVLADNEGELTHLHNAELISLVPAKKMPT